MPDHRDSEARIDALGRATAELRPDDGIVDAVMTRVAAAAAGPAVVAPPDEGSAADLEATIARLGRATTELAPHPALSEDIMSSVQAVSTTSGPRATGRSVAQALEHGAKLTAELCPAQGLSDAVMLTVEGIATRAGRNGSISAEGITRSGRAALLVAAALAAVSLSSAAYIEHRLDRDVMAAVDPVEASE